MEATFHLSLPCKSVSTTRAFYVKKIGATAGRETASWIDINLFGNQITFTKSGEFNFAYNNYRLGDSIIPAFHFGVILDKETWEETYDRLNKQKLTMTEKRLYLNQAPGEHSSFFLEDPNGYTVEFKCFTEAKEIFST